MDQAKTSTASAKCNRCNTSLPNCGDPQSQFQGCTLCQNRAVSPVAGPSGVITAHLSPSKRKHHSSSSAGESGSSSPKSSKSSSVIISDPPSTSSDSTSQPTTNSNGSSVPSLAHVIRHQLGFKCTICGKEFASRSNRSYHRYCDTRVKKPFQCRSCERTFAHRDHLTAHEQSHNPQEVACPECNLKFQSHSALRKHSRRKHLGTLKFKCAVCGKHFLFKNEFVAHELRHSGNEKPFCCDLCPKKFGRKFLLQQHMESHSAVRKFQCYICKNQFTRASSVRTHLLVHSDERVFHCSCCPKSFQDERSLKRHRLVHTKKHFFKCPLCATQSSRRDNMLRHLSTMHPDSNRAELIQRMGVAASGSKPTPQRQSTLQRQSSPERKSSRSPIRPSTSESHGDSSDYDRPPSYAQAHIEPRPPPVTTDSSEPMINSFAFAQFQSDATSGFPHDGSQDAVPTSHMPAVDCSPSTSSKFQPQPTPDAPTTNDSAPSTLTKSDLERWNNTVIRFVARIGDVSDHHVDSDDSITAEVSHDRSMFKSLASIDPLNTSPESMQSSSNDCGPSTTTSPCPPMSRHHDEPMDATDSSEANADQPSPISHPSTFQLPSRSDLTVTLMTLPGQITSSTHVVPLDVTLRNLHSLAVPPVPIRMTRTSPQRRPPIERPAPYSVVRHNHRGIAFTTERQTDINTFRDRSGSVSPFEPPSNLPAETTVTIVTDAQVCHLRPRLISTEASSSSNGNPQPDPSGGFQSAVEPVQYESSEANRLEEPQPGPSGTQSNVQEANSIHSTQPSPDANRSPYRVVDLDITLPPWYMLHVEQQPTEEQLEHYRIMLFGDRATPQSPSPEPLHNDDPSTVDPMTSPRRVERAVPLNGTPTSERRRRQMENIQMLPVSEAVNDKIEELNRKEREERASHGESQRQAEGSANDLGNLGDEDQAQRNDENDDEETESETESARPKNYHKDPTPPPSPSSNQPRNQPYGGENAPAAGRANSQTQFNDQSDMHRKDEPANLDGIVLAVDDQPQTFSTIQYSSVSSPQTNPSRSVPILSHRSTISDEKRSSNYTSNHGYFPPSLQPQTAQRPYPPQCFQGGVAFTLPSPQSYMRHFQEIIAPNRPLVPSDNYRKTAPLAVPITAARQIERDDDSSPQFATSVHQFLRRLSPPPDDSLQQKYTEQSSRVSSQANEKRLRRSARQMPAQEMYFDNFSQSPGTFCRDQVRYSDAHPVHTVYFTGGSRPMAIHPQVISQEQIIHPHHAPFAPSPIAQYEPQIPPLHQGVIVRQINAYEAPRSISPTYPSAQYYRAASPHQRNYNQMPARYDPYYVDQPELPTYDHYDQHHSWSTPSPQSIYSAGQPKYYPSSPHMQTGFANEFRPIHYVDQRMQDYSQPDEQYASPQKLEYIVDVHRHVDDGSPVLVTDHAPSSQQAVHITKPFQWTDVERIPEFKLTRIDNNVLGQGHCSTADGIGRGMDGNQSTTFTKHMEVSSGPPFGRTPTKVPNFPPTPPPPNTPNDRQNQQAPTKHQQKWHERVLQGKYGKTATNPNQSAAPQLQRQTAIAFAAGQPQK